jgi:hypothetical protein
MIRFLLVAFLLYVFFLIVSAVFTAYFRGKKKRDVYQASAPDEPNTPPKQRVQYTDVEDAKFEDIKEPQPSKDKDNQPL